MAKVKITNAYQAVDLIREGDSVGISEFWHVGAALDLINALAFKGKKRLHIIANDPGLPGIGVGRLINNKQIESLTVSFLATNPEVEKMAAQGKLKVNLVPQGTLITQLWAAGAGLGGFYTPTGVGTDIARDQEKKIIDGKEYIFAPALKPKYALVKAWKADEKGNLVFHKASRNFNIAMAMAADITIVEADEIVSVGAIDPDEVMLPFNFVDILVKSSGAKIRPWLRKQTLGQDIDPKRTAIAKRAAQEFRDGDVVNLGIGIPTLAAKYIPDGISVDIQSENGILGIAPVALAAYNNPQTDPEQIDAGGNPVTVAMGGAFFDSLMSFAMIRGGRIDVTVLGALEVDEQGNLANYTIPGKRSPGIGGGMDLAVGAKRVIVATEHTNNGRPKIVKKCSLPLTAPKVVDLIITELAVIEVTETGLLLKEIAPGTTVEEVKSLTEADLTVAENLSIIECQT